jgi:predicted transcriptional regulator
VKRMNVKAVRLTDDEFSKISMLARSAGVTISRVIQDAVNVYIGKQSKQGKRRRPSA